MYKWPLNKNQFTWLDRLKICKFFLNPKNRWTQDKYVREYERVAAKYVGSEYAIFVSSGSAANQLMCQYIKDKLIEKGEWPKKNKVVVSAVTWQTNVSVWLREGFEPIFIDINMDDFCVDYRQLLLTCIDKQEEIACIFPTAVLGWTPNIQELQYISNYTKIPLMMDACENFFGTYVDDNHVDRNVCYPFTSSTSCFFAHQITTGQEGGFIFTNNSEEAKYFILSRAHGLTRNINAYPGMYVNHNPLVSPEFEFHTLSSNYRNSDIAAYMGLLDFKRVKHYCQHRYELYRHFKYNLDRCKYYLPIMGLGNRTSIPFCFPIIVKDIYIEKVKGYLNAKGIEYRPFISGNMLRQTPYQKYGDYRSFPNAEKVTKNAVYIGYNNKLTVKDITNLVEGLNAL
jgi:CDP-6-deoxy-D-xylo-4-hexulose-3-dehydrase